MFLLRSETPAASCVFLLLLLFGKKRIVQNLSFMTCELNLSETSAALGGHFSLRTLIVALEKVV